MPLISWLPRFRLLAGAFAFVVRLGRRPISVDTAAADIPASAARMRRPFGRIAILDRQAGANRRWPASGPLLRAARRHDIVGPRVQSRLRRSIRRSDRSTVHPSVRPSATDCKGAKAQRTRYPGCRMRTRAHGPEHVGRPEHLLCRRQTGAVGVLRDSAVETSRELNAAVYRASARVCRHLRQGVPTSADVACGRRAAAELPR